MVPLSCFYEKVMRTVVLWHLSLRLFLPRLRLCTLYRIILYNYVLSYMLQKNGSYLSYGPVLTFYCKNHKKLVHIGDSSLVTVQLT
jgi:hypothetical protein